MSLLNELETATGKLRLFPGNKKKNSVEMAGYFDWATPEIVRAIRRSQGVRTARGVVRFLKHQYGIDVPLRHINMIANAMHLRLDGSEYHKRQMRNFRQRLEKKLRQRKGKEKVFI